MAKDEDQIQVAVQITSDGSADASLSQQARHAISQEMADKFAIQWLPPHVRYYEEGTSGKEISSLILLFISGSFFAPFVASIVQEAGKDFWGIDSFDNELSEQLGALARDWQRLNETIKKSWIGNHRLYDRNLDEYSMYSKENAVRENAVRVIRYRDGRFEITAEPKSRYLGRFP